MSLSATLPPTLESNPRLSDWVSFGAHRIVIRTGKVELGQGIRTAIAMIAAEELGVGIDLLDVRTGDTAAGPNELMTTGSMSIEMSGASVRQACAEIRHHLLGIAAANLDVDRDDLHMEDTLIKHPSTNRTLSIFDAASELDPDLTADGRISPRPISEYSLVGTTTTRLDLPAKITGGDAFLQDYRSESLVHARVVRPPDNASRLESIDPSSVEAMPGVRRVLIDGSFIGVIASDEATAIAAKARLARAVRWVRDESRHLPEMDLHEWLRASPDYRLAVIEGTPDPDAVVPAVGSSTLAATYTKPYHMHGSIGPSAAVARFENGKLDIKSHSQGPPVIQAAIASALDMAVQDISVKHLENAGCYGHNGADDAAMDAALLARALPDHDVLLKWDREDEHRWEPYSPAATLDMAARLEDGRITYWSADIYSQTHMGRPRPFRSHSNLIAAWHRADPLPRAEARPAIANHVGIHRNADPIYNFEQRRIIKHLVTDQRVRTSSTRGLGAYANVFAIESFMNELAAAAGADPAAFRTAHLDDPRAIEVVETAARLAREQAPGQRDAPWRSGLGLAFARYKNRQTYAAVAMFASVHEETFDITLDHAIIVADAGLIIDRDGLANQLEGGLIQSASWTLKEAVTFDGYGTASVDWEHYPILRFSEVPTVHVELIDRRNEPSLGAGEATQGPTPAAIAGAIFDATGLRIRGIPFTPDRLQQAALEDS